jgi:hypothetical protein
MEASVCGLIFSAVLVVGTVPVTVLLCRHRVARRKRVSFAAVWEASSIATLVTMWLGCSMLKGWNIVSWLTEDGFPVGIWLILWAWAISVSLLTSLGVVFYYRKGTKADEPTLG